MKKTIILTMVAAFTMMSCKNESKTETTETEVTQELPEVVDMHNAQNSLDYLGTYEGILPCASCEGIKTTITLNEDETFKMKLLYMKEGEKEIDEMGDWKWKDGSTIELEGIDFEPELYFVAENKIIRLDMEGNRITGDLAKNYELNKFQ